MPPRKVLFIHHGGAVGGSAVSMLQLVAALDRARFEPEVVFTSDGPILNFAREMDVSARVVPMRSVFFYSTLVPLHLRNVVPFLLDYRRTVATARELVRLERPDVVHLNTSVLVPAAVGVKQTNTPTVWHVREPVGPNPILRSWHLKRVKSLADHIIANSHFVARDYVGSKPVTVIHNTLDKHRFAPLDRETRMRIRAELGLPQDSPVVGMIGAVNVVKGHYFLVEAASLVVKEVPNVRFLVIAGGVGKEYARSAKGMVKRMVGLPLDNLDRMRRLVRKSGLHQHFVFSGFRSDIPELISAMDVLAFPSLVPEGFGRPLIEAMAMGCPVVATDIGPTREVVGEDAALLVWPGDVPGLASAILRVLKDRKLAQRLGDAGRRRFLQHFEMEAMQARVEDVYAQVLGREHAETASSRSHESWG